jgi:hypothetical protein
MATGANAFVHAPDYRPLAGNDHLTCAVCYEAWPCPTERDRRGGLWKDFEDD